MNSIEPRIKIVTEVPGPKSRELTARRKRFVSAGTGTLAPIFMKSGEGAILVDVDGNQYADLGCGIGVTTIGHAHPIVREAASQQLGQLAHTLFTVTPYEIYVDLCEKLAELMPGDFEKRSVLVNSGAEAVENAVKIARKATGKRVILALDHAFHGRTNLTMTMTYRPWPERSGMGPLAPDIRSVPSSYPFRDGLSGGQAAARTIDYIEHHVGADDVAALFVEPIQGDGGIIVPASGYLAALREYCTRKGIVLVADEIQAGIARTGKWLSIEHDGVIPDLITVAKGLAGGLPLAAVTGRAEIMDAVQAGGIGGTFGGNPAAVASALSVIEFVESEDLFSRAFEVEAVIRNVTSTWISEIPIIGDVRGRGAMFGVEIVHPEDGAPWPEALSAIIEGCYQRGVIVLDGGTWDSVARLMPSVTIPEPLLRDALQVFAEVSAAVSAQMLQAVPA